MMIIFLKFFFILSNIALSIDFYFFFNFLFFTFLNYFIINFKNFKYFPICLMSLINYKKNKKKFGIKKLTIEHISLCNSVINLQLKIYIIGKISKIFENLY